MRLTRQGAEYVGLCVNHSEKSPSCTISQSDGKWLHYCFGCGFSGGPLDFIMAADKVPLEKAIATLREELGERNWEDTKEVDSVFSPVSSEQYAVLNLNQIAGLEKGLAESAAARAWLEDVRGIRYETAKKMHIGFKPRTSDPLPEKLRHLADKGWLAFHCVDGDKVTSVKFRSLVEKAFYKKTGMATALYNVDDIDPLEALYVAEGELDVATFVQAGLRAVSIPSASTKVTPEMRDQIMTAEYVILAGDCDGGVGAEAMDRLWRDFGDNSYLIKWPEGMKDANQTLLEHCGRDINVFRDLVETLVRDAKGNPMPEFTSIQKALTSSDRVSMMDSPSRLHFPWRSVDRMVALLPGSVLVVSASSTGMGKTCWINELSLHCARQHGEVVINYQCEMAEDEMANMTAANVLMKERNSLTTEDNKKAARLLGEARYYIGRDATLTEPKGVLDLLEKAIRRLGATVVVLDHIHFLCRGDNELRDQAEASKRIKTLAQQYKVKFIVVAQPRKADSKNKGKALHVSDIKGSGAIMDDADALLVLHREYVKNPDPDNPPMDSYEPETEIHCLKARSKGDGAMFAKLMFAGSCATFHEMTPLEPPPLP
jgi:hypothetical protein